MSRAMRKASAAFASPEILQTSSWIASEEYQREVIEQSKGSRYLIAQNIIDGVLYHEH